MIRPEHPPRRTLAELAAHCGGVIRQDDTARPPDSDEPSRLDAVPTVRPDPGIDTADAVTVSGLDLSSHTVRPGELYVALPGHRVHGADFVEQARAAGAVAVLTDGEGATRAAGSGLPCVVVPDPRAILGGVAAWMYGTDLARPQLLAVTGTNGKTSVVHLLDALLRQLGVRSGLSSTATRRVAGEVMASSLTTPEASELHALLARGQELDVGAVAVEVSAQALSRHRVDGLTFDVAGFTNLSHDHLDDYDSMDTYYRAKVELFRRSRRAVILVDTPWGAHLANELALPCTTITTATTATTLADSENAGMTPLGAPIIGITTAGTPTAAVPVVQPAADWNLVLEEEAATHTRIRLTHRDGRTLCTRVPLFGGYMAANAALAIVMVLEAGYSFDALATALARDGGIDAYIPGRTELISGATGPRVYVDYAHTPDAFAQTLAALRVFTPGRVVMLFGADGDRDTTKRADMAAIAARGADVVVVTDFHPRFEDAAAIRRTLMTAARAAVPEREMYEIADPREALRAVIALAGEADTVLYAGPGHEDYHEVAGTKQPYSARDEARIALREAGWLE
ncbi:MAG: UDP-N-acetylmuramyl peptide synthase [Candidatus Lumbricidophila eiseniae]|uniref:UDP-N-acetylmuramyl-tripeptide synthetase n=1 Tax=Candidatus Lumbricidiphila eiseniae TaxID=1969409 RepID=A0A2A6FPN8_9MICO|nr:MAG: UDP-N-acetylmuramyl peptide synthase [Candidatus Lumbricidophila eiseniae]